jgi:acyl-CoA synthetase (AMP-forming)/AMP-acid ligase II
MRGEANTMGALHERNARYYPGTDALIFGERRLSHGQLYDRACRLASALYDLGLRKQERVGVLSANASEVYELYIASHIAGYIAAPVNCRLAAPEIAYILGDAAPRVLAFESQYAELVGTLRPQLTGIERFLCFGGNAPSWAIDYESALQAGAPAGPPIRSTTDDYAHLLYTSGTTGKPKGVTHTHRAVCYWTPINALIHSFNGATRVLQTTPLSHIGGISYPYAAWWMGGAAVLLRGFEPVQVLEAVEKERVTFTFMVATMVQAILAVPGVETLDLSSLRRILSAAAPIPVPLLVEAIKLLGPIFAVHYGATEFGPGCDLPTHLVRPQGSELDIKRLGSVGHVVPGVGLRIVDDADNDCGVGSPGEVLIKSDGLMSGYWNNGPATIEAIRDGWYRTGDLGYQDEEGFVFLVDRKKDMIISGGENVYSREVEEAIHQHPEVAESAVIGVSHPRWTEAVKAFVVRKPGATIAEAELIEHCRTLIARYKCPRELEFLEELPRQSGGKVDKSALRRREAERSRQV